MLSCSIANDRLSRVLTYPPIAVFEVLSPEDTMFRLLRKLTDYSAMGVRSIFVVDPRTAVAYRSVEGGLVLCGSEPELPDGSAARVDWRAIAELRD